MKWAIVHSHVKSLKGINACYLVNPQVAGKSMFIKKHDMYHYISLYMWTNWLKDVESEPKSSFSRSIPSIANLSVISCVFQGPGDFLTGANWNEYQKNKHHVLFPVGPACLQGSTSVFFPWNTLNLLHACHIDHYKLLGLACGAQEE